MQMISAAIITFCLSNIPFCTFVLAIVLAAISISLKRAGVNKVKIFLFYMMLLPVGVAGLWGFIMHGFFPKISASFIGWKPSPFQWEVAVANFGMALTGFFAIRASIGFQKATTLLVTVFLWGAAAGHVKQMIVAHNFAPGNAGLIFWTDIIIPLVLIILMMMRCRRRGKII